MDANRITLGHGARPVIFEKDFQGELEIYFETLCEERDHARWLTPQEVKALKKFLNEKFPEKT